jgi:hypothetical protein
LSIGPWAKLFYIEGNVKPDADTSSVFLKMVPPPWFYILFAWAPVLIFLQLYLADIEGAVTIALIWLLLSNFIMLANMRIASRIFAELDKVFEAANATPSPPAT